MVILQEKPSLQWFFNSTVEFGLRDFPEQNETELGSALGVIDGCNHGYNMLQPQQIAASNHNL